MKHVLCALVLSSIPTASVVGDDSLQRVSLSFHTEYPISVAEVGRTAEAHFELRNPAGNEAVRCQLHLAITDFHGRRRSWTSGPISLAAGETSRVPLGDAFDTVGWFRVEPSLRAEGEAEGVAKPVRRLAVIDPLESRKLPPEDGFWFGFDSRVRTPAMLRLLSRTGVDVVRYGTWARVNPAEGEYEWSAFDEVVDAMREQGLQPLYSVTFSPGFAIKPEYRGKGDPSRLPPRPEALKKSLEAIVAHTKGKGVTIYDLWNEPDHRGFWRGNTDDYLEFARVASETIHRVQPNATVLSGGIASLHQGRTDALNPDLDRRLIVEGRAHYDALALHEHGPFDRFAAALDGPLAEHLGRLEDAPPLWFTETGHDGEAHEKATTLVQKFTLARARGARGMVWYALYPPGEGGRYNVVDEHGDPEPVLPVYNQMVRLMRGKRFTREYEDATGTGNRLFAFAGGGETLLVAWGRGATAFRAPIRLRTAETSARILDLLGQPLALERSGDVVSLPFGDVPRYLVVDGEVDVLDYVPVTPLVSYEFGSLDATRSAGRVSASSLEAVGWSRHDARDGDRRMTGATSGLPCGSFDGEGDGLTLRFTVTPERGASLDFEECSFWGNAGAFDGTTATLDCRVGDGESVTVGHVRLANISAPSRKGEHHALRLDGLSGVTEPVTFSLNAHRRGGDRVILKIDDLRIDGRVVE